MIPGFTKTKDFLLLTLLLSLKVSKSWTSLFVDLCKSGVHLKKTTLHHGSVTIFINMKSCTGPTHSCLSQIHISLKISLCSIPPYHVTSRFSYIAGLTGTIQSYVPLIHIGLKICLCSLIHFLTSSSNVYFTSFLAWNSHS